MRKFILFFLLVLLSGCTKPEEKTLSELLDEIVIDEVVSENLTLPDTYELNDNIVSAIWNSDKPRVIAIDGKVTRGLNNEEVTLTVHLFYGTETVHKVFPVLVPGSPELQGYSIVYNLNMPFQIVQDIELPTEFAFDTTGTWKTSDPNVLTNKGKIPDDFEGTKTVTLTLTLDTGYEKEFLMTVSSNNHLIIDSEFNGSSENLTLNEEGRLVLEEGLLEGTYESDIYETLFFTDAVASWAATSSKQATVELFVRLRVNGEWSRYFSYGEWGLGNENKMTTGQSDNLVTLSQDELIVRNSSTANALQFKAILRRNASTDASPELALIAAALNIPDYKFNVDTSKLRQEVDYDVPKLYQHVVPEIGNQICSPTSATMLLQYYGHKLTDIGEYEYPHEYIARLFNDYGNNIFGNWVYNTVGISAFGEISYVKRMYSSDELLYHLDSVGPVSASVRGTLVGESGYSWTTSGHLIVVRGYRIEDDQVYILANDPNLKDVYEEYKLENFMSFWRNVVYIVE